MEYPLIKKHIGEGWLNETISRIEAGDYITDPKGFSKSKLDEVAYLYLDELEGFISKFEKLEGFEGWARQASTAKGKSLYDLIFELSSMEIFMKKCDSIQLKTNNGVKELEAAIRKEDTTLLVECTNLGSVPGKIHNKVGDLFGKVSKKFNGESGIHIVGTFEFFDKNDKKPTTHFNLLKRFIEQRFDRSMGKATVAYILCNFYIGLNPTTDAKGLRREYWLVMNPQKKEKDWLKFLEETMDVEDFKYYS